jgi:DNA-binding CsgD family transcriptional regulator
MHLSLFKKVSFIAAKYALAVALLAFFFSALKNRIYINYQNWDNYAAIVAVLFLAIGVWASKIYFIPQTRQNNSPATILSKRELEVMNLLCLQKTNQQIADELCIELSTLKTHINRIYKKLKVKNRQQLIALVCPPIR